MPTKHSQCCPVYQGRECDCNYIEPVASAGNALSVQAMSDLVAQAQIAFNLDKYSSFEVALIRKTEAALASQSTPVAQEPVGYLAFQSGDSKGVFFPSMVHMTAGTMRWQPEVSRVVPLYAAPTAAQGLSDAVTRGWVGDAVSIGEGEWAMTVYAKARWPDGAKVQVL